MDVQAGPERTEAAGLLALMLLTDARQPARLTPAGELVPLDAMPTSVVSIACSNSPYSYDTASRTKPV